MANMNILYWLYNAILVLYCSYVPNLCKALGSAESGNGVVARVGMADIVNQSVKSSI